MHIDTGRQIHRILLGGTACTGMLGRQTDTSGLNPAYITGSFCTKLLFHGMLREQAVVIHHRRISALCLDEPAQLRKTSSIFQSSFRHP